MADKKGKEDEGQQGSRFSRMMMVLDKPMTEDDLPYAPMLRYLKGKRGFEAYIPENERVEKPKPGKGVVKRALRAVGRHAGAMVEEVGEATALHFRASAVQAVTGAGEVAQGYARFLGRRTAVRVIGMLEKKDIDLEFDPNDLSGDEEEKK